MTNPPTLTAYAKALAVKKLWRAGPYKNDFINSTNFLS